MGARVTRKSYRVRPDRPQPARHGRDCLGRLGVHAVLRADEDRVGDPAAAGQLSPAGGRAGGRDAVFGGETGAACRTGSGYPDDGRAIRVPPGPPGIPGAALARPDNDHRDRCHMSGFPRERALRESPLPGFPGWVPGR
jgi:hypothetical protein